VMLIEILKEKDGRWVKYDSCYDTVQLLAPYEVQLGESEEAARDFLEQYMADLIVEFSRLVDGAFLPAQPCAALAARRSPPTRVRCSDSSTEHSPANRPLRNDRGRLLLLPCSVHISAVQILHISMVSGFRKLACDA
jgi:hypothetical protein